jgi:transposase
VVAVGWITDGDQWGVLADSLWFADLPPQYGNWKTVYNRHRRWSGDRTWVRILDEPRRDADLGEDECWTIGIDAGVVRAHQHAAGAHHEPPADIPAEVVATLDLDTGGPIE